MAQTITKLKITCVTRSDIWNQKSPQA